MSESDCLSLDSHSTVDSSNAVDPSDQAENGADAGLLAVPTSFDYCHTPKEFIEHVGCSMKLTPFHCRSLG
jgi:hypothetical protein